MTAILEIIGEALPLIAAYGKALAAIAVALAIAWFAPSIKVKIAAVGVALLILTTTIAFSVGVKIEHDRCAAAQQRAEREAKARDQQQEQLAAGDDDESLAQILKQSKSNQERFDAFKAELAKRQDAACRLTAGDIASLRLDDGGRDAEVCGAAAAGAKGHAAGQGTIIGRDAKAALADYRAALREANARICGGAKWYGGVRDRYGKARLR